MTWNPTTYLAHAELRERPALELLARVPLENVALAYDLGCGTGNSTSFLRRRWPRATIIGVDNSDTMLEKARASGVEATWRKADLQEFVPNALSDLQEFVPNAQSDLQGFVPSTQSDLREFGPGDRPDLIYSNAAYHWIDRHDIVFPRLADSLADHGVLAIQMPFNFEAPSHVLLKETAADGPWAATVANLRPKNPVHQPAEYYDLLRRAFASLDIWTTEYQQILTGDNPVLGWVKGTTLVPYLEALAGGVREEFIAAYAARLREAYPTRPDGKTLFPFKRLFIVGCR